MLYYIVLYYIILYYIYIHILHKSNVTHTIKPILKHRQSRTVAVEEMHPGTAGGR